MREQQRKTIDSRIKTEKEKFLKVLEKSPVVTVACEHSGVSKATFYRWKSDDKEFAEKVSIAMSEGNSFVNDMAIAQLISIVKEKHFGGIKFWLEKNHPDYASRMHVTADVELEEFKLSPELEALVRKALLLVSLPTNQD